MPDSDKSHKKSIRFVVLGLLGLAAGSFFLLLHKIFDVPELLADLSTLAGTGIVLYSNFCIYYGLLISAGARPKE